MRYFLLLLLSPVYGCQDPSRETTTADSASRMAASVPYVYTDDLPPDDLRTGCLDIELQYNDYASHYQYVLLQGATNADTSCDEAAYGEFSKVSKRLKFTTIGDAGLKILCIRGKDIDGRVQEEVDRHQWERVAPTKEHADINRDGEVNILDIRLFINKSQIGPAPDHRIDNEKLTAEDRQLLDIDGSCVVDKRDLDAIGGLVGS